MSLVSGFVVSCLWFGARIGDPLFLRSGVDRGASLEGLEPFVKGDERLRLAVLGEPGQEIR